MTEATEDLFTAIHKGLRSMMYDLSSRLQTNDFGDPEATRRLATDLEYDFAVARTAGCMVCVFHHHAEDEETFVFPAVKASNDRLIHSLVDEHHGLTRQELAITAAAREIPAMPDAAQRIAAGIRLNQAMNELLATYLAHMNREETELVPHMRAHFTDAQMAAMRGGIMGGMPPDRLAAIMGWMLPSLNATELTELLRSVRQTAPPPLVAAAMNLCEARVEPSRWALVKSRLAG